MESAITVNTYPFLTGGGELGELTRQFDWSATPLGVPDQWPLSLQTTVSIILNSKFPMFLWWGDDLIQFYNDAYRPSLGNNGKHPTALGQSGAACWPEIWPVIKPLIDQVLAGGEATWSEDQLIPIYRNGQVEDVYWTFSYSAVKNQSGQVKGVLVICTETTQAIQLRQNLLRSQQQFQNLVSYAPVAIALFKGPQFVIELANDRVLEYWGRRREEVINKPLFVALPEAGGQGFEELLMGVYTTGERFVAQELIVTLHRKGQLEQTYIDFVYEPFREANGTISGITVVCIEITEQVLARQKIEESEMRYRALSVELEGQVQERTQQLQTYIQDLQRSNENLQKFAYVASHDLQEPLRKIQQFGDILKSQYRERLGSGVDYLERMQSAANRMSLLIRDLLNYSRISTHRDSDVSVSLHEVVNRALTDLELVVAETGAQITVEPLPTIWGDSSQLEQLFLNLLSNALKFRQPDRRPQIDIRSELVAAGDLPRSVKPARAAPAYHCFAVADNGIGFEEHQVDRIFEVFQRLHGKNQFAGTGIGLAICEKVAINHGGAITARSQPGQGATFKVYLPVWQANQATT